MKKSIITILSILTLITLNAQPPNILFVIVDDMGYGDLSCYGSKQIKTPHIDALAASGIRFTQAYVTSTVCAPSRAGLLTGRYQNRFGFEHNLIGKSDHITPDALGIPREEELISNYLKDEDYQTACIGKWHLGKSTDWQLPNERGFDYFFGMLNGNHNYFPTPEKNHLWRNKAPIEEIEVPYLTDWFTKEAIQFISQSEKDQPWFLYLSYNTPHTPLQAKEEDLARFQHIADEKRRTYAAMQYCLDENIGKLLQFLEEEKMRDNTLILFISDNGGPTSSNASINAPLRGQKSTVLEGGFRVPLMMSWPKYLPKGRVNDKVVSALDILPTLLAATQKTPLEDWPENELKNEIDGVNLFPYLMGNKQNETIHSTLYWRMVLRSAAILDDNWKLIRLGHRPPELYYLPDDISELNNLAVQHPQKVVELMSKLHDWELNYTANPLWLGEWYWAKINRTHYDREYILDQPK